MSIVNSLCFSAFLIKSRESTFYYLTSNTVHHKESIKKQRFANLYQEFCIKKKPRFLSGAEIKICGRKPGFSSFVQFFQAKCLWFREQRSKRRAEKERQSVQKSRKYGFSDGIYQRQKAQYDNKVKSEIGHGTKTHGKSADF